MAISHMIYRSTYQLVLLILLSALQLAHMTSAPHFIQTPSNQTGVEGGVASFVCQTTGDPQPKILWTTYRLPQILQEIEFAEASGSVLRIQPLQKYHDEAVYECVAFNEIGEIRTAARLSVLQVDQLPAGFPSIDMGPQVKVVERSRTATMLCAASGSPDPEITWFKDSLPIDTNGRIKLLLSGALQIENSEVADQGKYECVATNNKGTRYSAPASLFVREPREVRRFPPRFSTPPMDHEILLGESVNLTCVAVGAPMPYVKWMHGNVELTPEDEMPIGRNVLEIRNVRQSANYTCVAISSLGMIAADAKITVKKPREVRHVPPRFSTPPMDHEILRGESVNLTCVAVGAPMPYVKWMQGDEELTPEDEMPVGRNVLELRNVRQSANYTCVAISSLGMIAADAKITIKMRLVPPRFSTTLMDHEILLGESVNLTCVAVGAPMPYVKWMQGDEELTPEDEMPVGRNVLELRNVRQSANYTCVAISSLEIIETNVKITIKVPSQPRELKADVKSETSFLLTWIPPAHSGTDSITGYELIYRRVEQSEQKISVDPGSSYLLDNLNPFSSYAFKLAARNKHGLGSFTKEITVSLESQTPKAQTFCVKL